jgi:hypothetical protein
VTATVQTLSKALLEGGDDPVDGHTVGRWTAPTARDDLVDPVEDLVVEVPSCAA